MDDIEPEPATDLDIAPPRGRRGGPGAPAVLRGIPWLALVFVALAIADLYWMLRQSDFLAGMSAGDIIGYGLRVTPGIAAILMPAAVLASHRDLWRRIPTVVFGTILFASVQGLAVVADPLQPIFASLTPASAELPDLVPLAALFDAVVSLASVLGVTYIALGLVQARRYEDRPADAAALVVPVAATLATIIGVLAASRFDFGDTRDPAARRLPGRHGRARDPAGHRLGVPGRDRDPRLVVGRGAQHRLVAGRAGEARLRRFGHHRRPLDRRDQVVPNTTVGIRRHESRWLARTAAGIRIGRCPA